MSSIDSFIKTLDQLCALLVTETVTVAKIATLLGEIEEAGDEFSPTIVRPVNTALESAAIEQDYEGDEPSDITLWIASSAAIPVAVLHEQYGDSTDVPMLPSGGLHQIHFELDLGGPSHTCALFASVEDGLLRQVLLRRDIRLD